MRLSMLRSSVALASRRSETTAGLSSLRDHEFRSERGIRRRFVKVTDHLEATDTLQVLVDALAAGDLRGPRVTESRRVRPPSAIERWSPVGSTVATS
jgi:hypothetical protein